MLLVSLPSLKVFGITPHSGEAQYLPGVIVEGYYDMQIGQLSKSSRRESRDNPEKRDPFIGCTPPPPGQKTTLKIKNMDT